MTGEGILVRDCMEWKIRQVQPYIRHADKDEYVSLLMKKLLEEVGEVVTAFGPEAIVKELADVMQVVYDLAWAVGSTPQHVYEERVRKFREKGGFGKRVVLAWRQPEEASPRGA